MKYLAVITSLLVAGIALAQTPGKNLRAVEIIEKKLVGDEAPCKQDGDFTYGNCFECCNFCEPVSSFAPADWKICTSNSNEQLRPSSSPTSADQQIPKGIHPTSRLIETSSSPTIDRVIPPHGMHPTSRLVEKKKPTQPTPSAKRHPTPSVNMGEFGKNLRLVKPTENIEGDEVSCITAGEPSHGDCSLCCSGECSQWSDASPDDSQMLCGGWGTGNKHPTPSSSYVASPVFTTD